MYMWEFKEKCKTFDFIQMNSSGLLLKDFVTAILTKEVVHTIDLQLILPTISFSSRN